MKNIVLIGMPGSGKSTVGVLLAKALGCSFVDTDLLLSRESGKTLQRILNEDGLDSFLKEEEKVGCELECSGAVIATGGSMVLSGRAMKHLKENAAVVYIDVELDEIKRRVTNIRSRGIAFKKGETLDDVYAARTPLYKKYADITVAYASGTIEDTVDMIAEQLTMNNIYFSQNAQG